MQALSRRASGFRPFQGAKPSVLPRPASRQVLQVRASEVAAAAKLPYKGLDGADKGTQSLALKVATDTAVGLVHRYMVMAQQNARRVSPLRRA